MTEPEKNTDKNSDAFTRKVTYVPFNTRLMAATVDVALVTIIGLPLVQWLQSFMYAPINGEIFNVILASKLSMVELNEQFWEEVRNQHVFAKMFINNLLQLITLAIYILPFWFKRKMTLGKALLGIEIVDATTYEPMTRKQSIKRFISYLISGFPFTLGFVWMNFNKKKQCWHDKIAHTIVIKKERKPKQESA